MRGSAFRSDRISHLAGLGDRWTGRLSDALRAAVGCSLALVLGPGSATAQNHAGDGKAGNVASTPSVAEIVDRFVERSERQEKLAVEIGFESYMHSSVESLNADGEITDVRTSLYRRYALEGTTYLELVERDGRQLEGKAARDAQRRKARFIREARRHAARGETYAPDERGVKFNRELMRRYRTTLVGAEELRGHDCWVIRFEPREGPLPEVRRMDKALNRSEGRIWITQDGYNMARVSFEMREPVRYMWGVLATLRSVAGQADFEMVRSDLWMPKKLLLELDLTVLLGVKDIRRRVRNRWEVRRPVASLPVRGSATAGVHQAMSSLRVKGRAGQADRSGKLSPGTVLISFVRVSPRPVGADWRREGSARSRGGIGPRLVRRIARQCRRAPLTPSVPRAIPWTSRSSPGASPRKSG